VHGKSGDCTSCAALQPHHLTICSCRERGARDAAPAVRHARMASRS
jgi:hypothetical protein